MSGPHCQRKAEISSAVTHLVSARSQLAGTASRGTYICGRKEFAQAGSFFNSASLTSIKYLLELGTLKTAKAHSKASHRHQRGKFTGWKISRRGRRTRISRRSLFSEGPVSADGGDWKIRRTGLIAEGFGSCVGKDVGRVKSRMSARNLPGIRVVPRNQFAPGMAACQGLF